MAGSAADEPSALDPLLDLFVYAPIGMIYEYPDVLDTLVKRGKSQIQLAKLMTQMAGGSDAQAGLSLEDSLGIASKLAEKVMTDVGQAIAGAVGLDADGSGGNARADAAETAPTDEPATRGTTTEPAPVPEALPIASYDTLKAKEIIPLLQDLSAAQRDRVLAYEEAHKARKTILAALASQ